MSGLEISASDFYLSDTRRGLIMTNVNADCFRLYVGSDEVLKVEKIDCPD